MALQTEVPGCRFLTMKVGRFGPAPGLLMPLHRARTVSVLCPEDRAHLGFCPGLNSTLGSVLQPLGLLCISEERPPSLWVS